MDKYLYVIETGDVIISWCQKNSFGKNCQPELSEYDNLQTVTAGFRIWRLKLGILLKRKVNIWYPDIDPGNVCEVVTRVRLGSMTTLKSYGDY